MVNKKCDFESGALAYLRRNIRCVQEVSNWGLSVIVRYQASFRVLISIRRRLGDEVATINSTNSSSNRAVPFSGVIFSLGIARICLLF